MSDIFTPNFHITITPIEGNQFSITFKGCNETGEFIKETFSIHSATEIELNKLYEELKPSHDIHKWKFRGKQTGRYRIFGLVTQEAYEKVLAVAFFPKF